MAQIVRTRAFAAVLRSYADRARAGGRRWRPAQSLLIEMSYRLSTQPELGTRMRAARGSRWMPRRRGRGSRGHAARRRLLGVSPDLARASRRRGSRRRRSDKRRLRAMSAGDQQRMPHRALQLRDVRKTLRRDADHVAASRSTSPGASGTRIIGPNGAGKSTLFNSDQRPLRADAGLDPSARRGHRRLRRRIEINRRGLARSFQVTNIFPRLTVFENIRCSVLWSLGLSIQLLAPRGQAARRQRADGARRSSRSGMTARRDALAGVLTYAEQRALGDRHHDRRRRRRHPARRTDRGHEPQRGRQRGRADPRRVTQGRTLVMVEHDMGVVFDLADRISVLVLRRDHRHRRAGRGSAPERGGADRLPRERRRCLRSTTCTRTTARATSCRASRFASARARS